MKRGKGFQAVAWSLFFQPNRKRREVNQVNGGHQFQLTSQRGVGGGGGT